MNCGRWAGESKPIINADRTGRSFLMDLFLPSLQVHSYAGHSQAHRAAKTESRAPASAESPKSVE